MSKKSKLALAILFCIVVVSIALKDNWDYRSRFKTGEKVKGTIVFVGVKNIKWVGNGSEMLM